MPRKYIKKKVLSYTQDDMNKAMQAVRSNEISIYAAAKQFNIPTTTLFNKMKGTHGREKAGRPQAISSCDEERIVNAIVNIKEWGFSMNRHEILDIVENYINKTNLKTPFNNNRPGLDWLINFKKRHGLSIKKLQPKEHVKPKMSDPIIHDYFKLLQKILVDLNLFKKPNLIWNLDETSLSLDPIKSKEIGKINKPCSRRTHGTGKENVTVLAAVNAAGEKNTPLIIFKGKQMWDQWMANVDEYDFEISYTASSRGWMDSTIFYNYLDKIFIPSLEDERPVLLIYGGHSTYVDVNVVELAVKNNITILKLPSHMSHLLQPLDVTIFKSLKSEWDTKLIEWKRHNIGKKMSKRIFAQTFAEIWQQTDSQIIRNSFKKTGISPLNPHVITQDMYDPLLV